MSDRMISIFDAIEHGYLPVVKNLIEQGVDVNMCDRFEQPLLYIACVYDQLDIARYLIEKGADVNQIVENNKCGSSLQLATEQLENIDLVKLLVENGADVNLKDNAGYTAYTSIINDRTLEIANYLKEHGAIDQ